MRRYRNAGDVTSGWACANSPPRPAAAAAGLSRPPAGPAAQEPARVHSRRVPFTLSLALVLFVLAIPFKGCELVDLKSIDFGLVPIYAAELLLALAFLLTCLRHKMHWRWPRPIALLAAFGLMTGLSVFQSAWVPAGLIHLSERRLWLFGATQAGYVIAAIVAAILLFYIFVNFPASRRTALRAHFAAGSFVSLWGFYQLIAYYRGWDYPTIFNNNLHYTQLYMESIGGFKRLSSTASEPSWIAIYLISVVMLSFYAASFRLRVLGPKLDWVVFAISAIALMLTVSLTGFLGAFLFLILLAVMGRGSKLRAGLLAAILALSFLALIFSFSREIDSYVARAAVTERFVDVPMGDDLSVDQRFESMVTGFRIFLHHPAAGVGIGNSVFYYYLYSDISVSELGTYTRIHALGVRILAEHGLLGAFLLLGFAVSVVKARLRPGLTTQEQILDEAAKVSFLVCFVVMLVTMGEIIHFEVWFSAAMLASFPTVEKQPGKARGRRTRLQRRSSVRQTPAGAAPGRLQP